MGDSIWGDKFTIFNKTKQFLVGIIEPNELVSRNDELNYELIKYIWGKNYRSPATSNQLEQNNLGMKSSHNIDLGILFQNIALELKNNTELKDRLNMLLSKITRQSKKKYTYKSLKILYAYGALHYSHKDGSYQQESVIDFVKRNLNTILSQGKLKEIKVISRAQSEELINENQKVISELEKLSSNHQREISLKTRKIILKEIKQYVEKIHKDEQVSRNTKKVQQMQQQANEVVSIMYDNLKKIMDREESLNILEEKACSIAKMGKEFLDNTKRIKHKTANKKIFYYAAIAAAIIVIALACYIYTIFNSPNQSLDNVTLTQNIGELIRSVV